MTVKLSALMPTTILATRVNACVLVSNARTRKEAVSANNAQAEVIGIVQKLNTRKMTPVSRALEGTGKMIIVTVIREKQGRYHTVYSELSPGQVLYSLGISTSDLRTAFEGEIPDKLRITIDRDADNGRHVNK